MKWEEMAGGYYRSENLRTLNMSMLVAEDYPKSNIWVASCTHFTPRDLASKKFNTKEKAMKAAEEWLLNELEKTKNRLCKK